MPHFQGFFVHIKCIYVAKLLATYLVCAIVGRGWKLEEGAGKREQMARRVPRVGASQAAALSFRELLDAHRRNGTRPDKDPRQGKSWTYEELGACAHVSGRSVGNWCRGDTRPRHIELLLQALFGPDGNPVHNHERRLLCEAFRAEEADSSPRMDHAEALLAPDRCLGRETEIATLTKIISSSVATAVTVLGPPGIGKTTLTRQVAVSKDVVTRFGRQRWLIKLSR
jgi:hypothetical protein